MQGAIAGHPQVAKSATVAPAMPAKRRADAPKTTKAVKKAPEGPNPLFPSTPKNLRVGGDVRPTGRDLSRFVRWPKYVRLQRQRKILFQRLKVPPSVHQFSKTLDKNQASELFKLLTKYTPETSQAKYQRIQQLAEAKAAGQDATPSKPGPTLKYGLKHVTYLVEQQKAKLVVIAHDVNPIELVLWLPALCRKMNVPFCIVKSKSRLGALTHKKTAAVVALTEVNKEDEGKLNTLAENFKAQYTTPERKWGGGIMGLKTQAKLEKRRQAMEAEMAKRAAQY